MSLIVARKAENRIIILSDTKLTYERDTLNKNNSHPQDSTIKAIILNSNLCVCFAGERLYAEKGFALLNPNDSFHKICEALVEQNVNSMQISAADQTEFLVAAADSVTLYEIKNGRGVQVDHSWLGSAQAFNKFQGYFLGQLQPRQNTGVEFTIELQSSEGKTPEVFSKMEKAFDAVIDDASIREVDGFKIRIGIDKGEFRYLHYVHSYSSNPIKWDIPPIPGTYIRSVGHGLASEGAYTVNFFGSSNDFKTIALHIQQGELGIIFQREIGYLFEGKIFRDVDELDFIDIVKSKYGFETAGQTQIVHEKYWKKGNTLLNQKRFTEAITAYEEALLHCHGKVKAQVLYNIGLAYVNLNNYPKAMITFGETVKLDYSLKQRIEQLLSSQYGSKK